MNICFADGRPMLNKEILKDKSVLALEFWGQACFIHVFKKEKKEYMNKSVLQRYVGIDVIERREYEQSFCGE